MVEEDYTILLVEDTQADATMFREILADTSYSEHKLRTVDRLSEAIKVLEEQRIDIVVLDLNLPDSKGFETFTTIYEKYENIPIIVYTITDDEYIGLEAIRRGAEDYLVKGPYLDTVQIEKSIRKAIELNKNRKAIRKTLQALQRTNGYLEHFAYVASHDLNAPIINLEELSKMINLDESSKAYNQKVLNGMDTTIRRMRATLNGLFSVMDIYENLDDPLEALKFEEVMQKVMQDLEADIQQMNAHVEYDFSQAPEVKFPGNHLKMIIHELVANALTHQPEGQAPQVKLRTIEKKKDYICLEVTDNGIGFHQDIHSKRIFDLFTQPHAKSSHSGIGLYTVKTLAENHGGFVEAESDGQGQGALFRICFSKYP